MLSDPLRVVAMLGRHFDALDIRYLVGGSLASSVYGPPRATQERDVLGLLEVKGTLLDQERARQEAS